MRGHRLELPLAIVATVAAAGAATLLLRPRGSLIEPAAVSPTAYFSPEELERARDYRGPQRALALAGLAVSGGTLALLALRPPAAVRGALGRGAARPLTAGAAAGAGISLVLVVVGLPLDAVGHARAVDVGLSTQDWLPWLGDVGKSAAIAAVLSAAGAALAIALVRRFPRHWWLPGAGAVVVAAVALVFLSPLVLEPLFNRFEPLPRSELRSEVLRLAERSGVDVGEVFRVDASRRTTGANAYVGGLGSTKRVVLYDNLIEGFRREQVSSVVAHELAHVKHRDLWRGLLWLAIVAPAAVFLVQRLSERLARRGGWDAGAGGPTSQRAGTWPVRPGGAALPAGPAALPALALSLAVVSFGVTVAGNVLSRRVEARADVYALELTRDPEAHIGLERRLAVKNVSDPDPPALLHALFGTHPTTIDRIGLGLSWARQR